MKAITGVTVFAGLWGVSTGNWAELCLEEVNDVKIYLPCTENFSLNETPPTPSGTKSELRAETLMQIIDVASHSLNEEFDRRINFLLMTADGRAGENDL